MKLAVISDIHGNMEAFTSVLADIDAGGVDEIISLGDNIGYGPDPGKVIQRIQERQITSILGNHELGVCDRKHLDWFNTAARASLQKTIQWLTDQDIRFISSLKNVLVRHECRFVHGFPPDCPMTYLFQVSDNDLQRTFSQIPEKICFTGHTHFLKMISFDGQHTEHQILTEGKTRLNREKRYILNIGSVGQPRDGNNKAKYVIWDTTAHTIDVRFIAYDIAAVVEKILTAGLPTIHALRLR